MNLPEDPDTAPEINIVPMIDVIFVVLTFFILSSLFLTRSEGLPVDLPGAATSEQQLQDYSLTLTITPEGNLQLGNEATSLSSLASLVQTRRVGDRPLLIIIRADAAVPHGQVVAVMDQLRTLDNVGMAIATQSPSLAPAAE
ncbi:MAG: biopolymer transporter ExbD [Cyanobacteria bacterium P01_D01_bin.115]